MDTVQPSPVWPSDPTLDPTLPLADMKVLDLTTALAGPCCTEMLADMGADVIKIEDPRLTPEGRGGPPLVGEESGRFVIANRNKRSLTLRLDSPQGKDLLQELLRRADVLVENQPSERMGGSGRWLSYEHTRQVNPGIIYASISGFGKTSPRSGLGDYDTIAQGLSGLMMSIGEEGRPPVRSGGAVASVGASIFTGYAILSAYIHCQKTGQGQFIDTSLLDVAVALQVKQMLYYFLNGNLARRMGSGDMNPGPYRAFKTKDGGITLGGTNANLWPKMCESLGVPGLIDDPRFDTPAKRTENGAELTDLLKPVLLTKTTDEWLSVLREKGVPSGPVYNLAQTAADPQVQARQMIVEVEHPSAGKLHLTGIPVKLSRTPGQIRRPPPMLGEHTHEILQAMGYSAEAISAWREQGVV